MNYRQINRDAMVDTKHQYETDPELIQMVHEAVEGQFMVSHEEDIDQPLSDGSHTQYIVAPGRSFFEARRWAVAGQKVAVLNFANNHSVGGAPFSAGAQEESLCRCSTLLPCLEAMRTPFYQKHCDMYASGQISHMGNDDLIYTPGVCVFKTDELADPIIPEMMPRDEWYRVDVITCAAPELRHGNPMPDDYEAQISRRIKKILDVAKQQGVEVLILGAWGCGAFRNPEEVVARLFRQHLRNYSFPIVIFPMGRQDYFDSAFFKEFGNAN